MSNRKISQLEANTNLTINDIFPIVNSGVTKKQDIEGLLNFLTPYFTSDVFISGASYDNTLGVLELMDSTGGTISVSGFYTGSTEVFVNNGNYSNGVIQFTNTTGGTFNVTGLTTPFTGGFITGLTANTISATTYENLPINSIATSGSTLYSTNPSTSDFSTSNNIFFGSGAGYQATYANYSNFLGQQAGYQATYANDSNFFGQDAGSQATDAYGSNFIGNSAGSQATYASGSNFFGPSAGYNATNASDSNFFGSSAGFQATNASKSTLIGFNVGRAVNINDSIGSNNIIIGTNITLSANTTNRINIGGVLFGMNTYSATTGNPFTGTTTTGRIGVRVVNPTANLHIGPSTTAQALMRLEVGPAPLSPNDGDIWLESNTLTGLKIRINGVTRTINII